MEKLQLDTEKIDGILKSMEKDKGWLAMKTGMSRQLVWYHWQKKPVKAAPVYAELFRMNPKDLIK